MHINRGFLLLAGLAVAAALPAQQPPAGGARPARPAIRLSIPAFPDGGSLPDQYSCVAGEAMTRPKIEWSGPTPGVVSFVLLMHDADIHPGRSIYDNTHWLVWNIPAGATEIAEGSPSGPLPEGAIVGKRAPRPGVVAPPPGYAGPCPPPGNPHHYWFELFALDVALDLPAEATRAEVFGAMDTHIVGKSVYASVFNRRP